MECTLGMTDRDEATTDGNQVEEKSRHNADGIGDQDGATATSNRGGAG